MDNLTLKTLPDNQYGGTMWRLLGLLTAAGFAFLAFMGQAAAQEDLYKELSFRLVPQYLDDLGEILSRKHIRVLTTMNRTNFFVSEGMLCGFEYSLLKEYERSLNEGRKKGELKVVMEFIPVPGDQLIQGLVEGYGDIAAAALTITPERESLAAFTDPYLTGVDEVVVTHRSVRKPKDIEDLSGRRIFVRENSSYYRSLVLLNTRLEAAGRPPVEIIKTDENLETEDVLEMVNAGGIEMTVAENYLAKIWAEILKNIVVMDNLRLRSGARVAWMVRKDNHELKANLDRFLTTHRKGTLLGNIYFDRYYKHNRWLKNPLGDGGVSKVNRYKRLFKKYADRYGFDWVLILALAYQESELNNSKRNPSGAVGIMQVLPSTAGDRNIGIEDVHFLENNIHAGVKYLAFLRDRYFNDQKLRHQDRVHFALASYNAGPAKIRKARVLAREMGLDSDRWFSNVEVAVIKIVGDETVGYVSNINKYYNLYRYAENLYTVRSANR